MYWLILTIVTSSGVTTDRIDTRSMEGCQEIAAHYNGRTVTVGDLGARTTVSYVADCIYTGR